MMQPTTHPRRQGPSHNRRRGAVLVWFVCIIPIMLLILFATTDFGTSAMARVELQNAIDASALSAVKTWSQHGPRAAYRDAEVLFAANPISARKLGDPTASAKDFIDSTATILGFLEDTGSIHVFHPLTTGAGGDPEEPDVAGQIQLPGPAFTHCVCIRRSVRVQGLAPLGVSMSLGPYVISGEAYARLNPANGMPQLVHIDGIADMQR